MPNLLQSGSSWLAGRLKAAAATAIVYRRGEDSVELSATVGRTETDELETESIATRHRRRDYIVAAADLVLGGTATLPVEQDLIEETTAGVTRTYEVLPLAGGEHYRFCDPHRGLLRIHTVEIAVE